VFNPLYENIYDKQPFENSDINLDDIAPIVIPELDRIKIFNKTKH
jgi:hypothetical protein